MKTVPQVTAQQAQAAANHFLSNHLPDRFTADQAQLTATGDVWQVPVILAYPFIPQPPWIPLPHYRQGGEEREDRV